MGKTGPKGFAGHNGTHGIPGTPGTDGDSGNKVTWFDIHNIVYMYMGVLCYFALFV